MKVNSCRWLLCQAMLLLAFVAALAGCGPSLSSVSGTVTYKGEKVTGGTLIFAPIAEGTNAAGPPSTGTIQPDGTFVLKNNNGAAGGVVGKNTVSFSAPGGEASTDPKKDGKPSPYAGLVVKDTPVEIKSGANTLTIELVKGK